MGGDMGEHEEVAPRMAPASGLEDGAGLSVCGIESGVAAIGVGLQNAAIAGKVLPGMFAGPVGRIEEQCRRRRRASRR
jgi:hypothetical protein